MLLNLAANPAAGPIADSNGNLYIPTTIYNGVQGGAVQQLAQDASGAWSVNTLWVFGQQRGDGAYPNGLLLLNGNLFGTTEYGGKCGKVGLGCGIAFELSPSTACPTGWCETILYTFKGDRDGANPQAALIADQDGNLYGTTFQGGGTKGCEKIGCGTIFELIAGPTGYTEQVLYRFPPRPNTVVGKYGSGSIAPLFLASDGSLLGTAQNGGSEGFGTVFQLSPQGSGWALTVLHDFDGKDGAGPSSGLVLYNGAYYGVTSGQDGIGNQGTAYRLTPTGTGWDLKRLAYINANSSSIGGPNGNVVFDSTGAFYFATNGFQSGPGAILKVDSGGHASLLHEFSGPSAKGDDAEAPWGPLVLMNGELYGVGWTGGDQATGALFSLAP